MAVSARWVRTSRSAVEATGHADAQGGRAVGKVTDGLHHAGRAVAPVRCRHRAAGPRTRHPPRRATTSSGPGSRAAGRWAIALQRPESPAAWPCAVVDLLELVGVDQQDGVPAAGPAPGCRGRGRRRGGWRGRSGRRSRRLWSPARVAGAGLLQRVHHLHRLQCALPLFPEGGGQGVAVRETRLCLAEPSAASSTAWVRRVAAVISRPASGGRSATARSLTRTPRRAGRTGAARRRGTVG